MSDDFDRLKAEKDRITKADGNWKRFAMECMRFLNAEQIGIAAKAAGAQAWVCNEHYVVEVAAAARAVEDGAADAYGVYRHEERMNKRDALREFFFTGTGGGPIAQQADSQISLYNSGLTLNPDATYLLWTDYQIWQLAPLGGQDFVRRAFRDTVRGSFTIDGTRMVLTHSLDSLGRTADTAIYTVGAQTIAAVTRRWAFWGVNPSQQSREVWYQENGAP